MLTPDLTCEFKATSHVPKHVRRAWKLPGSETVLARWFVSCPHVHAAWESWLVTLVHLRPIPGFPEAIIHEPGAMYELGAFALDPSYNPTPDDPMSCKIMLPQNISVQFEQLPSDADAVSIAEACVLACVGGSLAPEIEWRRAWSLTVAREVQQVKLRHNVNPTH